MTALIWWLLQCSFVAALAIPIVAAACRFFRRRPAVQHVMWAVLLIKFLTPSIVVWPWPILDVLDSTSHLLPASNDAPVSGGASAEVQLLPSNEALWITSGWASSGDGSRVVALISMAAFTVWLVGAGTFAAKQFFRIRNQRRLLLRGSVASLELESMVRDVASRLGIHPPKVLIVKGTSTPAVWCLGKPTLLWPEELPAVGTVTASRSLVAHELAHIRRRDHWMARIQLAAGVIWWWNPLFWIVNRQLTTAAEVACDAIALEAYPQDQCAYAEALLNFVAPKSMLALAMGIRSGSASSLERRMHFIVSERVDGGLSLSGVAFSALIALMIAPSWSFNEAQGGTISQVSAADHADLPGEEESRESAVHKDLKEQARKRLIEAGRVVDQAKAAQASANRRLTTLKQLNDHRSGRSELDEAIHILELTDAELEYAEAFRDLAEKQMNAVR